MPDSCRDATSGERLQTHFSRSAKTPWSDQRWMELKECPARSARTRRILGNVRWGPLARGAGNGMVLRNRPTIKYRDFYVQHCNNLPVPPQLLAASCPLACVSILTYPPARTTFDTLAGWTRADSSCSRPARHECLTERNFDTEPQYPYCYGSRPNNRLESTANAHTAADLHVRPVS
jgi:hypothetical protein